MEPTPPPTRRRKRLLYGGLAAVAVAALAMTAVAAAHGFGGPGFGRGPAMATDARLATCQPTGFTQSGNTVTGGCVSFTSDAADGSIAALAVTSNGTATTLLDKVTVAGLAGATETLRRGYALEQSDVRLGVMDAPTAGLLVGARNGTTVTLEFPAGANLAVHAAVQDWSPAGATVTVGTLTANLVLPPNATLTQSGNTLTVTLPTGELRFGLVGMPAHEASHDGFGPREGMRPGEGMRPRDGGFGGPRGPRDGPGPQ